MADKEYKTDYHWDQSEEFLFVQGMWHIGMFLLSTEFKVGGYRKSIFIPEGKAKNGWRVFGLELRKLLEPENYVNGGSGLSKFVA